MHQKVATPESVSESRWSRISSNNQIHFLSSKKQLLRS
ncbi:hypothetical protein TSAR_015048 [Trichomalopsis sarcophagae]|uniref:Uncharacterized protein n=1 Tax=Trichomalopsis sarcophagae TaxID=543379 RepID=A0A232F8N5_9HYME|nr:hypothetical protein TSAR_015048 [Trichomalopsis sarcophagae]